MVQIKNSEIEALEEKKIEIIDILYKLTSKMWNDT